MGQLYIIRHGETDYNKFKRYSGRTDVALNNEGRRQAKLLRNALLGVDFDVIFSSPLKRAFETACIIADKNKIRIERELREIDFGDWEGLNLKQINNKFPDKVSKWFKKPIPTRIPGGESYSDVSFRVEKFFDRIKSEFSEKTVAFVTHHTPFKVILFKKLNLDAKNFWNVSIDNASVCYFRI